MRGRAAPHPGPLPASGARGIAAPSSASGHLLPMGEGAANPSPSGGRWREAPDEGDGLTPAEVEVALRGDFYSFLLHAFVDRHGAAAFVPGWHIEVMAAKLAAVREGRRPAADRQHSAAASEIARRLDRAAGLAARPRSDAAIVNVTYGQELSDEFARDCRAIMASSWYRALFPTRLVSDRAAADAN